MKTLFQQIRNIILCAILASVSALGQDKYDIEIVTDYYPPYNYQDTDGNVIGFSTDIVRAFMDKTGFTYSISMMPWGRAITSVQQSDNVLIYSLDRIPEREKDFHWLQPLQPIQYSLVMRAHMSQDDLLPERLLHSNLRAICVVDTAHCASLKRYGFSEEQIMQINVPGIYTLARMISYDRADVMIADMAVIHWHMLQEPLGPKPLKPVKMLAGESPVYLAAGKNIRAELLTRLKTALQE